MAKEILVAVEILQDKISDISYEMLGVGRKLADNLKVPLLACLEGGNQSAVKDLGAADKVFFVENSVPVSPAPGKIISTLAELIKQKQPALVLIGWTNVSAGVGSMLALRTGLTHINFVKDLSLENGTIIATSQLFGGKILAEVEVPPGGAIVSVVPGAFKAEPGKSTRTPEIELVKISAEETKITFKQFIEPETGDVDITKQDVLVCVGRGIENDANLEPVEELAKILGGTVCGSRPVIDQGWLSLSRQVGKSGMIVKPKLFLALGISGAPEHTEGMKDSELIIAINKDPKAPIFDVAHCGAVADVQDLVPILKDAIVKRKGQ